MQLTAVTTGSPEAPVVITTLPDGQRLSWGGTRTKVNLKRPAEAGVLFDPARKCPFHNPAEASLEEFYDGELRLLGNPTSPHNNHRLIIPKACTDEATVRTLGGVNLLTKMLYVSDILGERSEDESLFAVHVLRGQNQRHLHMHFYNYWPEEQLDLDLEARWTELETNPDLIIREDENFQIVSRGTETGQIFLIPVEQAFEPARALAEALSWLVELTNQAFKSDEGELPRYTVTGRRDRLGDLRYLVYSPALQMPGCGCDLAPFNRSAMIRTWSPQKTAEHLKTFIQ